MLHVHPIRTSPYHPQTNGLVERFNKTLKAMLRKTVSDDPKMWDKMLPYLLFAYREVPHVSTGFAPFEVLYGHTLRGPLDILHGIWGASKKSDVSVVSHVLSMRERSSHNDGPGKGEHHQGSRKAETLVRSDGSQTYLSARKQSAGDTPDLYQQVVGPVARPLFTYRANMHDRRKQKRVFHVNMLRKWHEPVAVANCAEETTED